MALYWNQWDVVWMALKPFLRSGFSGNIGKFVLFLFWINGCFLIFHWDQDYLQADLKSEQVVRISDTFPPLPRSHMFKKEESCRGAILQHTHQKTPNSQWHCRKKQEKAAALESKCFTRIWFPQSGLHTGQKVQHQGNALWITVMLLFNISWKIVCLSW